MPERISDKLFTLAIWSVAIVLLTLLFWIVGDLVWRGAAHLSLDFILSPPANAGRDGGISSILVSTILILGVALMTAVPVGLAVAIWLAEYTRINAHAAPVIRTGLDVLAGVPSIVFGLFGNAFFCIYLGLGFSILSGGLTLACMILPIFIRTCESGLRMVPDDWRHGGSALGMTRASTVMYILLPASAPAILAGLLLGTGRATAETAALMFTSGYVDRMPSSLYDSGRALSVHIYDLSMNVTGGDNAAYATALVLIILIIAINGLAIGMSDQWLAKRVTPA